ncbi:MAG: aminotransferase class III-fold pyridoxal phosphate-dependent enzyme [Flavobacteriales bacterium]|nr:aminotransferase class III-fold pyridoxal phosphate-dependent enzyme [Flavobacteriales bacterium]
MQLFDVYPLFDITPVRAEGAYVYDAEGTRYLDLYGGHAVISIGHSHPHYVQAIHDQIGRIGFYSNSVKVPQQMELATRLGRMSGYDDYQLFLCNSGAEANENAIKLASFHTGRKRVVAFRGSFHGRTAAALNMTDDPKLSAPVNMDNFPVTYVALNDPEALSAALSGDDVCAVIVEGIQGVGGLGSPSDDFLRLLESECKASGALLILDEIQSGHGRTGKFFAHQQAGIRPDIITIAKGMGNGFPVAGVIISPAVRPKHGMLGTTFGGSHLACAAAIAVLDVLESEQLMAHVAEVGARFKAALEAIPQVVAVKGRGLMLGAEFAFPAKEVRTRLLMEHHIFTGASSNPNQIRILPPLNISWQQLEHFIHALETVLR